MEVSQRHSGPEIDALTITWTDNRGKQSIPIYVAGSPHIPHSSTPRDPLEKTVRELAEQEIESAVEGRICQVSVVPRIRRRDGKVAKFTVDGEDLTDRIMGTGDKVSLGRLGTIEFLTAYQSVSANGMVVNLLLKTKDLAVATSDFYSARYRAPDGRQATASENTTTPDELGSDSTATVSVFFDRAKPGGELRLSLSDVDYNVEREVKIKTR